MGNTQQKTQKTEHEHEHEQEDSNFTCEICVEPMLSTRKFKNGNMCTYQFCRACIAKYIDVKVKDNIGNIRCPGLNCEHLLDPIACRTIIARQLFEEWCDLLCDSAVLNFDRFYCPYQNCSALVLNECRNNELRKVKCPKCKRSFCFHCKTTWYTGYWCSESHESMDRNEVRSRKLIEKKKWTRCRKCGQAIERVGGCKAVRCRCGAYICHDCGGKMHFGPCDGSRRSRCSSHWWWFLTVMGLAIVLIMYLVLLLT